jgi:Protein of unknown function (DUF3040)
MLLSGGKGRRVMTRLVHTAAREVPAMSLGAREQHTLKAIEDRLASSDPKLGSKLATFSRLSAGEAFPAREQIRPGPHLCRQLAWPLLWLAVCAAVIAAALLVAHTGGPGTCPNWQAVCGR